jgi:proteasome lid subunit RPN8/RPN11
MKIPRAAYDAMAQRAAADYPEETCGLVFGRDQRLEVVPMRNIWNDLHRQDPERYDRDARSGYCFDPFELERVVDEKQRAGLPFRYVYHSHPDHEAYFSPTDSEGAAPGGEPLYEGVVYLVLSVVQAKVRDMKAFDWAPSEQAYVEVPVSVGD